MTSLKVMASSTRSKKSDIRRRSSSSIKSSSISELHKDNTQIHNQQHTTINNLGSMTVDGLLRNMTTDNQASYNTLLDAKITLLDATGAVAAISDSETTPTIIRQENVSNVGNKTVDDVWKEVVGGHSERRECKVEASEEMITLEDFLAGAVEEEDVKIGTLAPSMESLSGGFFTFDSPMPSPFAGTPQSLDGEIGFGNGSNGVEVIGGRGKRSALLEPLDKVIQQRQKRMIKNRECATRSRERKQAYEVELESLAVKLKEENQQLLKEKAEQTNERFKQLMEKVIPVVEQRRPARALRRVCSMPCF